MSKNLSIHKLILIVSLIAVVAFSGAVVLWGYLINLMNPVLAWLLLSLLIGAITYGVYRYILNNFLYRRIKLIYKLIRSSKVSMPKGEEELDQQEDSLAKVEHEVRNFMVKQQEEIDSLKELENYRKNFLGNISHELKTPIFSVQGYIHTLLDGGMKDDQVNRRFLEKAANNIERLETVVNDLEIIAKLENATMELEYQKFDLKELTLEVFDEIMMQANQRDINVVLKSGADIPFYVEADREYIRTVIINLMVNSIKYGKEGGVTKVGFYDMENYVLLEVADDGIGIEEKHIKHLFDRFYRVDKSRSRQRGGSGLGLSIVKHIIEAHDQRINVRSTAGLGTTIGFTLQKAG